MKRALDVTGLAALIGLLAGCATDPLTAPASAQDSASLQTAPKPTQARAVSDAGANPAQTAAAGRITREEFVALMLDAKIREATPEQTSSRFTALGELTRSSMFPDQLDLRAENPTQRVIIEYVQSKGGFKFAHLRAALWVASSSELKAAYDATDAQLAKALGKPQWTKKVPDALPNRAYRVGKKLSLVLGEGLEKGKNFVRIELSEPQGERE
jgi:hypothetical protein